MKYLITALLLLTAHYTFAQNGFLPLDAEKNVTYSDLGNARKTKDELYKSAQNWVLKTFGNYENAVTLDEPQAGKLVVNSYVPVGTSSYEYVRFNVHIQCADNHFTARIDGVEGISPLHTAVKLGVRENDAVLAASVAVKSETNKKKRVEAEHRLERIKANNDRINAAMYDLLATLKQFMVSADE